MLTFHIHIYSLSLQWWQNDTANVISTMLFLSGVTTILHCYFGTQLSLVQGSSFVYLAPALVIINAEEFRNLTHHVSSMTDTKCSFIVLKLFMTCTITSSNLNPGTALFESPYFSFLLLCALGPLSEFYPVKGIFGSLVTFNLD